MLCRCFVFGMCLPSAALFPFGLHSCLPPAACQSFTGFVALPDVDRNGDDIANAGTAAASRCLNDPNCKAFNSQGWMKRFGSPANVAARGSCLYIKLATGRSGAILCVARAMFASVALHKYPLSVLPLP